MAPTVITNAQYHSFIAKKMNADAPQADLGQAAAGNCEGDEMKALITDLERCSTSTGPKPLSPAQLKASLTAATAFMEHWQHTVNVPLEMPSILRNRTQRSTGQQGEKPSQIL